MRVGLDGLGTGEHRTCLRQRGSVEPKTQGALNRWSVCQRVSVRKVSTRVRDESKRRVRVHKKRAERIFIMAPPTRASTSRVAYFVFATAILLPQMTVSAVCHNVTSVRTGPSGRIITIKNRTVCDGWLFSNQFGRYPHELASVNQTALPEHGLLRSFFSTLMNGVLSLLRFVFIRRPGGRSERVSRVISSAKRRSDRAIKD